MASGSSNMSINLLLILFSFETHNQLVKDLLVKVLWIVHLSYVVSLLCCTVAILLYKSSKSITGTYLIMYLHAGLVNKSVNMIVRCICLWYVSYVVCVCMQKFLWMYYMFLRFCKLKAHSYILL